MVALLVVNDWVFKRAVTHDTWQSAITGKLSDIAGLAFAPVVLSSAIGLVLHVAAVVGARVDPSLSRRRLVLCTLATGAGFAAVKLSPVLASHVAGWLGYLGRPAAFYDDWTDLLTLPALGIALWIGRDELARVPLGRAAGIHRTGKPARAALADVGGDVEALANAIDRWDTRAIDERLSESSRRRR